MWNSVCFWLGLFMRPAFVCKARLPSTLLNTITLDSTSSRKPPLNPSQCLPTWAGLGVPSLFLSPSNYTMCTYYILLQWSVDVSISFLCDFIQVCIFVSSAPTQCLDFNKHLWKEWNISEWLQETIPLTFWSRDVLATLQYRETVIPPKCFKRSWVSYFGIADMKLLLFLVSCFYISAFNWLPKELI